MKIVFDGAAPPGTRLQSIIVGNQPIDRSKSYNVATSEYLAKGKDGYDTFAGCPQVVNGEDGGILPTIVRNYFVMLKTMDRMRTLSTSSSGLSGLAKKASKKMLMGTVRKGAKAEDVYIAPVLEERITILNAQIDRT
eukprot:NODE_6263_length_863_cov_22.947297_g6031_i0.p1 GENE.NODE_6263_length_863_cov_22.947297_g6031_i0~~NODE_6263_length_863_cov_22.947297_g6031_i0.p1  ORF type:complete len:137 (-),score=30.34 NODE_6263_length_863_cov_22.947297_g6031_i0:251-661(-)